MQCCRGSIPSSQPLAACQAPQWPTTFAQMLIIATQKIESGNMTVIGTPTTTHSRVAHPWNALRSAGLSSFFLSRPSNSR
jgi:hypothetical protein